MLTGNAFVARDQTRRQRGGIGGIAPPRFLFLPHRFISCPPTVFFLKSEHRPHS